MLVRMWYARYLQSYLISRYMALTGRGVLKNLILGIDFLPNYTSDFLEIFFLNRPKWALLVFKISMFPFQNCERYSTHKFAKNQGPTIEPAWDEFFFEIFLSEMKDHIMKLINPKYYVFLTYFLVLPNLTIFKFLRVDD